MLSSSTAPATDSMQDRKDRGFQLHPAEGLEGPRWVWNFYK